MSRDLTPDEIKAWIEQLKATPMLKCKCGTELTDDKEFIVHDCDYYPADILEHDSFWDNNN